MKSHPLRWLALGGVVGSAAGVGTALYFGSRVSGLDASARQAPDVGRAISLHISARQAAQSANLLLTVGGALAVGAGLCLELEH